MRTSLHPMPDRLNLLVLHGITILDMDDVDAWMEAIDMFPKERHKACRQILTDGSFAVCNIEHRLEMRCYSR